MQKVGDGGYDMTDASATLQGKDFGLITWVHDYLVAHFFFFLKSGLKGNQV